MRRRSPKENPGTTDVTGRLGEQRSMPGSIGDRHYNRERSLAGPMTFFWRQRDSDAPWLCWGCGGRLEPGGDRDPESPRSAAEFEATFALLGAPAGRCGLPPLSWSAPRGWPPRHILLQQLGRRSAWQRHAARLLRLPPPQRASSVAPPRPSGSYHCVQTGGRCMAAFSYQPVPLALRRVDP